MEGTDVGEGGRGKESPGAWGRGDWRKVGAVSLIAPIKVMTQRHRIPVSTPSPHPYPHRANMALQRGAQSSVELLQWLAWGLGPPKISLFPFPAHPTLPRNLTPPHKTWFCSLGALAFPQLCSPNPIPTALPGLGGLDLWPLPPWGTQTSGPLLLALAETQASDTPIPAQASEVLVVGGEAHHPRLR